MGRRVSSPSEDARDEARCATALKSPNWSTSYAVSTAVAARGRCSGRRWGEECVVASPIAVAASRTLNCRDGLKAIDELSSPSLAAAGGIPGGRG